MSMGFITSLFVRKMVKAAGDTIDQRALLQSVGIDPDRESDPATMVSDIAYYELLESIAKQTDVTDLPLRSGQSMKCDDYGAFGLAWKSAPTLRGSIARAERYARLLTSVTEYHARQEKEGLFVILHRSGDRRLGMRLSNEATIASITSISRQVSQEPLNPLRVNFKHPPPRSIAAHTAYFGCPVYFDSDIDAVMFSNDALNRPNRLGDGGITRFLLNHLDAELDNIKSEQSLVESIQDAFAQSLSDGVPKVQNISRRLGMSERTLHRRLAEQGLTFQKLLESARRDLAEGLLSQSTYSIAEVAFLTGFSEQSAFSRAFKRWVGRTPASFRRARLTP